MKSMRFTNEKQILLLLSIPFVLLIIALYYVPLFGWVYTFFDYKPGIPITKTAFVGLEHFKEIFSSTSDLGTIIVNTLSMNFLNILAMPIPVLFAIIINEVKNERYRKVIQTSATLPNFISWVTVYALAFSIFSSEGQVNQLMDLLGFDFQTRILSNTDATWFFQTFITLWKTVGWNAIIYIAAIAGIDPQLYDAVKVDGASKLQTICHVVIPGIMPTFMVLLLLSIGHMFSSNFDQYFVFYNSVIADKIEVLDYFAYRSGIIMNDYPLGTAISMAKSIVSVILIFFANGLSKKLRGQGII